MAKKKPASAKSPEQKDIEAELMGREFEDFVKGKLPASKAKSIGKKLSDLLQNSEALRDYMEGRKRFKEWLDSSSPAE